MLSSAITQETPLITMAPSETPAPPAP